MIQAGRNGIIFHSCHAAFPFLHLSLSFGCAISFCKKTAIREKLRPLFRKAGFFPFSLLSPFLSAGREHGSTPISRSAFCRHFVDIPFCGTATCCQFSVLFVATSIQSDRITRKYLPILRTYSRNAHHCAGGRIALSLPLQLRFSAHFQNSFPPKSSSFSDAKIVCRRERLWKS